MNKSSIGIIGGMGPEASDCLYKLLIDLAIKEYGAKNNDDFPAIDMYSVPVPDFISNNKDLNRALKMLKQKMELINKSNAASISIACNTAHILLPKLQIISKAPFVSMIEEMVQKVYKDGKKKVGLMATPSTIKYCLYQEALSKYGISTEIPSKKQIAILERVIRNVLKGRILKRDTQSLVKIADKLRLKGVEGIILGCTELPLIFPKKYKIRVYNPLQILAKTLLRKYYT